MPGLHSAEVALFLRQRDDLNNGVKPFGVSRPLTLPSTPHGSSPSGSYSVFMNFTRLSGVAATAFALCHFTAMAQSPFLYHMTLRGTSYQTNATGNLAPTPLTEKVLVDDAATKGGVSPSSVLLVYHLQSSGLGDTIDFVDANTGITLSTLFGLYFGDDATLGRTAATNATQTEVRRLDYIYTQQNTTYTSYNSHSMGSAFTVKRFLTDTNGITQVVVEAQMSWIANPSGTNGTRVCTANISTSTPFR